MSQVLTIPEFTQTYRISRSEVYRLLRAGKLSAVKVGRRTLISQAAADRWFKKLEACNLKPSNGGAS